jgi:hypothetical protein
VRGGGGGVPIVASYCEDLAVNVLLDYFADVVDRPLVGVVEGCGTLRGGGHAVRPD